MLNISSYLITLKKYAKNPSESMEDFARAFLEKYIKVGNIRNKNGDLVDLDKSRISLLLNHKSDVPKALREKAEDENIKEKMISVFPSVLDDEMNMLKEQQIVESISSLINTDSSLSSLEKNHLFQFRDNCSRFLLEVFYKTLTKKNKQPKQNETVLVSKGKNTIEFIKGDLFKLAYDSRGKKKRIAVIPVDTSYNVTLDTKLEHNNNPRVSEETIHGQFISRLMKQNYDMHDIKDRIYSDLDNNNIEYIIKGEERIYPIGTIASLDFDNKAFYLLALSEFDKKNIARSSVDNIKTCILSLIDYYDEYGQGYPLYLPLIGTGRSRANLDYQQSYDVIVSTLVENINSIHGRIILVVLPDVYQSLKHESEGELR